MQKPGRYEIPKLKDREYYRKNKQIFNREYNVIYKKYSGRIFIGSCSYLYKTYKPQTRQEMCDMYFSNFEGNGFNMETLRGDEHYGRSFEQFKAIAQRYYEEILSVGGNDVTFEQCFDDLINHVIIETFDGQQAEAFIVAKLKSCNFEVEEQDGYRDAICGVDVVATKNGKSSYIQIKPITTFLGNKNQSLVSDRINFFKKQELLNANTGCNNKIIYMCYNKDLYDTTGKLMFLKNVKNNNFRFDLSELCDMNGISKINLKTCIFEEIV